MISRKNLGRIFLRNLPIAMYEEDLQSLNFIDFRKQVYNFRTNMFQV